jgi:hypothetical protein
MSAGATRALSARSTTHIVLETAESAPEIALFKVVEALNLPCEQSTAEWAVLVSEGGYRRRYTGGEKSSRVGHDSDAEFFARGDH